MRVNPLRIIQAPDCGEYELRHLNNEYLYPLRLSLMSFSRADANAALPRSENTKHAPDPKETIVAKLGLEIYVHGSRRISVLVRIVRAV
jgi:hypothetical protein